MHLMHSYSFCSDFAEVKFMIVADCVFQFIFGDYWMFFFEKQL